MKSKILMIAAGLSIASSALAADHKVFDCVSEDGSIQLAYITGPLSKSLHVTRKGTILAPQADQKNSISAVNTPIGELVSSTASSPLVPDAPQSVVSIFIPHMVLDGADKFEFKTYMMEASLGGYTNLPTSTQHIEEVTQLTCEVTPVGRI